MSILSDLEFCLSNLSALVLGNTALTYACAGGYVDVVKVLLESGASIEDHNENGHTPLMEAGSAGHVEVARVLLENGAGINTHSNEFKESALTLACYKGMVPRPLLRCGSSLQTCIYSALLYVMKLIFKAINICFHMLNIKY